MPLPLLLAATGLSPWLIDGAVIVAYFALILGIGLYASRGQKSIEDYALGHRSVPWWAVLASILAAEVSAGTFLGTPGEGYGLRNFTYAQLAIGTIMARIIVAYVFIQRFYQLGVVSIYEFLEVRFSRTTKRASSLLFLVTRALASGSRMYVPAILLVVAWQLLRDVNPDLSQTLWLYVGAVGLLTLVTAIYTTLGGIKAVVWTDLIQVFLMFGAMGYALWTLWRAVGGWGEVRATLHQPDELIFWDTGIVSGLGFFGNVKHVLETEYTVWSAFLASVFVTMATHGTDQDMVQRMLTAPDIRRSRRSLILSGLADVPVAVCFTLIGVLLWVYYHQSAHASARPEQDVFVNFILRELPVGVRGIMAAGLFATAMGSLSTALNALATSFTRDFYLGLFRPCASSVEQMRAARVATVGFAILLAAIGVGTAWVKLTHPQVRIIPIVLGSFGYTYGALLGIFLLGMTTRTRGNTRGNLLAMACGLLAVAVLSDLPNDVARMFNATAYPHPGWLPTIEFPWRIFFGTVVTFLVAACFRTPADVVARLRPVPPA
ncbi:MAG: sodium:solute symporter [Verrucomicrobia bacterium]|nr:sodium:solute symporter [Verrucomicrobiota bacterium]